MPKKRKSYTTLNHAEEKKKLYNLKSCRRKEKVSILYSIFEKICFAYKEGFSKAATGKNKIIMLKAY